MKRMSKFIMTTILTCLIASPGLADEATCKRILGDCNTALNAEITENNLQKQIIADQDKQHTLDQSRIQDLEARDSSLLRSPYLWGVLGMLAGGYIVSQVRK